MNTEEWGNYMNTHTQEEYEQEAARTVCTMCGKPFDVTDMLMGDNRYDFQVGYGSKRDTQRIRLDLCTDCFDRVLDMIISMCRTSLVVEEPEEEDLLDRKKQARIKREFTSLQ